MQTVRPFVMSIAGYDPSGGAGLLADIKTMEQLQVMGFGVCTAMTLQTESQCLSLEWHLLDRILKSIDVLIKKYHVRVVKIGVVKDAMMLTEIVKKIRANSSNVKIVWDPVLKSTSEFTFFDVNTLSLLKNVLDQIDLITPNYNEYKILEENHLLDQYECAILIKGGHRDDQLGVDVLIDKGREVSLQPNEEISEYFSKHGSGCVLSSAIASWLAQGESLEVSCRKAKLYIEQFLKSNPSLLGFHST
ncbi:hydroxymethylpyrimidine/phosphomethylpyrimidine kinase [Chryseobacterium sp. Alg-005]|uniref:hydroxymethylpyrimidine/phosphomethylpyrimidine kinase n=1 Tax=Chryseobacterium sp. Alg-005 TaxID=3159516 RepID=UPI003555B059